MNAPIRARNTGAPDHSLVPGSSTAEAAAMSRSAQATTGHGTCRPLTDRAPAHTAAAPPTRQTLPSGLPHHCWDVPSSRYAADPPRNSASATHHQPAYDERVVR